MLYLAASGVGAITVVGFDSVEMSNLHRQIIHCEANVGMNKAVSACRTMKKLHPTNKCTPIQINREAFFITSSSQEKSQ